MEYPISLGKSYLLGILFHIKSPYIIEVKTKWRFE